MAFVLAASALLALATAKRDSDTTRCYSCMSEIYRYNWKVTSQFFKRPEQFTDRCATVTPTSPRRDYHMTTECNSVCISLREIINIQNAHHEAYIRGCFDSVLQQNYRFNQTIVNRDGWLTREICANYPSSAVFSFRSHVSKLLSVCVCYGDKCNAAVSKFTDSRSSRSSYWLLPVGLLTLGMLTGG